MKKMSSAFRPREFHSTNFLMLRLMAYQLWYLPTSKATFNNIKLLL